MPSIEVLKTPVLFVEKSYKKQERHHPEKAVMPLLCSCSGAGSVGFVYTQCGGRVVGQCLADPRRAGYQLPGTIWAAALEAGFGTGTAERAFEGADHNVGAVTRQVGITALAVGA
jgi:hypothetical protein